MTIANASRPVRVDCDGCGTRLGATLGGWPALQRLARNAGWVFRRVDGGGVMADIWQRLCPDCAGPRGGGRGGKGR